MRMRGDKDQYGRMRKLMFPTWWKLGQCAGRRKYAISSIAAPLISRGHSSGISQAQSKPFDETYVLHAELKWPISCFDWPSDTGLVA